MTWIIHELQLTLQGKHTANAFDSPTFPQICLEYIHIITWYMTHLAPLHRESAHVRGEGGAFEVFASPWYLH